MGVYFICRIITCSLQALQTSCAWLGLSLQGCKGKLLENSRAVAGGTRGFSLHLEELQQSSHLLLSSTNLFPHLESVPTPIIMVGC